MAFSSIKIGRLALSLRKADRLARLGLCFGFFGSLCLVYLPVLCLLHVLLHPWPALFSAINRRMTRLAFRLVLTATTATGLTRVRYHGAGTPGALMVANHVSMLDILFILARFRDCYTFVNAKFRQNPLMGPIIAGSNYIVVDRASLYSRTGAMDRATEILQGGGRIIVFPEGTRSRDGTLGALEGGAFRLAAQLGVPITPVFILSDGFFLNKSGWDGVSPRRVCFDIYVENPIVCGGETDLRRRGELLHNQFLACYQARIGRHGPGIINCCQPPRQNELPQKDNPALL